MLPTKSADAIRWADLAPESAEMAYRRGYVDGWVHVLDVMHDLMFEGRIARQDAYTFLWEYGMSGPLWEWRRRGKGGKRSEWPPDPTIAEAREWLGGEQG